MKIELPVQRYRLLFSTAADRAVPAFSGNVWRGAFGHALRELACLTAASACAGCERRADCAYAYLFETPPPAGATLMRLYPSAPHPFILRELAEQAPGTSVLLLTLMGKAQGLLALVVEALRLAAQGGRSGRGIDGQHLQLIEVHQELGLGRDVWQRIDAERGLLRPVEVLPAAIPVPMPMPMPMPVQLDIRLRFITPLRVKREGKTLTAATLDFAAFFGALMRRISMLQAFHTGQALQAPFAELAARSREVQMRSDWQPAAQQRFSSRQKRAMPMDGLIGDVALSAADAQAFWPFLWLGQFVHAGSAATMGLGCYEIERMQEPTSLASVPTLPELASLPTQTAAA